MALGLLKLLGLATLALLGASLDGPLPVTALSVESHHVVRHDQSPRHNLLARQQNGRNTRRRCRAPGSNNSSSGGNTSRPPTQAPPATPRPTTTQKPATTSPPAPRPPATNGSRKVGLAFAGRIDIAKFAQGSPKLAGVYNWCPYKDVNMVKRLPNGAEFIPMLWGHKQIGQFTSLVKPGYAKTVLGMNEPNEGGQSNMNAQEGARMWRQYIQPLASQGYRLISPAPTNGPSGEGWLKEFFSACSGCTVDGVATHFYGTDAEALIGHINRYHQVFGRPVWLTEFACQNFGGGAQCSKDQVFAFMKRTTQYMDSQGWVALYCWFGSLLEDAMYNVNRANQLANGDSTPNALGRLYLGLDGW